MMRLISFEHGRLYLFKIAMVCDVNRQDIGYSFAAFSKDGFALNSTVWFGANDIDVEGSWVWDHNKQPATEMVTGGMWSAGEPDGSDPTWDCGALFAASPPGAYAMPCTDTYPYVCMEMRM
ncbi:hypothetical protein Btru_023818 [Bulinus truncatus]|nr:hypothetical protein Btru_023818 [Bulinus truncatus]